MKRANLLQLSFVIIGIVFGFFSLPVIFSLVVSTVVVIINGGYTLGDYILYNVLSIIAIALQVFVCWILITRADRFADAIQKRAKLGKGFSISSSPNDLLHVLLIVCGVYLLLTNLSPLLKAIFLSFKDRAGGGIMDLQEKPTDWITIVLNILLPVILLMYAKLIADYFAKKITDDKIVIEEENTVDQITKFEEE